MKSFLVKPQRHFYSLICSFILLFPLFCLQAGEVINRRTGQSFSDLQDAIDQAHINDTLDLSGEFIGSFVINKSLKLQGVSYRDTKLDGNKQARVLTIFGTSDLMIEVHLKDLTIRNGFTFSGGGGIFSEHASLKLNHVKICKNRAGTIESIDPPTDGGGMEIHSGILNVQDSIICENFSSLTGGGVVCSNTEAHFERVQIINNGVFGSGGGISLDNQKLTMMDCSISGNRATHGAGGLLNFGTTHVNNCIFDNNHVTKGNGGAIYNRGNLTIFSDADEKSKIMNNTCNKLGGGLFNAGKGTVQISNCSFNKNTADDDGGAIFNNAPTAQVILDRSTTVIKNNSKTQLVNVEKR